ncbi:MAG: cyclic nucleotide-binding domain-containing protein, partial [Actinomycetes bacterium]
MPAPVERLTPAELRTLFLFEALDDDKLSWLAETGRVEHRSAGEAVYTEGEEATCFFVLLDGTVLLSRRVADSEVEISRTNQRGVYAGATQAYLAPAEQRPYVNSLQSVTDSRLFVLEARTFATTIRTWFPMAMHLLEGLFVGMRASDALVGQRER